LPLQLPLRRDPLPLEGRPDPHRSRTRHRRPGALRGRQLPGLRGALLEHLPADAHQSPRGVRLLRRHRGLHLRDHRVDPPHPHPSGPRSSTFTSRCEAIGLAGGIFAAKSVGNYRDLYRIYRSDPLLQQAHQRWPVIVTWDDHEYSNDCHGSVATYTDGRTNEQDDQRRRNAEQAFVEYLPVDEGPLGSDPTTDVVVTEQSQLLPNQKVWRSFVYGKHLELVMTDLRSFRPDHPVPEDAFPGTVTDTQETIIAALGRAFFDQNFPPNLTEYINIDDASLAAVKGACLAVVTAGAQQSGLSASDAAAYAQRVVKGNLGLLVVNQLLAQAGQPPIPPSAQMKRGLFFALIGQQNFFNRICSL